jgi:hypothetical protein
LFNEAKLLKCLGRLSLLLHDGKDVRWPLRLEHTDPDTGFQIDQDPSSGSIYCVNLKLYLNDAEVPLCSGLNSREAYPLMFTDDEQGEGDVFTDDGEFTQQFTDWLDSQV